MTNIKMALYLNAVVSLSMGIVFLLTMVYSSNGGISTLPQYARIANINGIGEGWYETILLIAIGVYGITTIRKM
jgi:hypothetical protein